MWSGIEKKPCNSPHENTCVITLFYLACTSSTVVGQLSHHTKAGGSIPAPGSDRRHDLQHNDIQYNDTQHKGLTCDIQQKQH